MLNNLVFPSSLFWINFEVVGGDCSWHVVKTLAWIPLICNVWFLTPCAGFGVHYVKHVIIGNGWDNSVEGFMLCNKKAKKDFLLSVAYKSMKITTAPGKYGAVLHMEGLSVTTPHKKLSESDYNSDYIFRIHSQAGLMRNEQTLLWSQPFNFTRGSCTKRLPSCLFFDRFSRKIRGNWLTLGYKLLHFYAKLFRSRVLAFLSQTIFLTERKPHLNNFELDGLPKL